MTARRWNGPTRIAHRCGGTLAPENTLAAVRVGLAHGYRAVEFDVMLTADDVPVLMHDCELGRTVDGHGAVAALAWAELSTRDAGRWWSVDCAGERVPRYVDIARFCLDHGIWMNVEIKPSPGTASRTGRVVGQATAALIDGGADAGRFLFSSFDVAALDAARAAAPEVARGILFEQLSSDAPRLAASLGCISVHVDEARLDVATIEALHAAGLAVLAYTVDDVDRARSLDAAGLDALFTDRIDLIPFA